MRHHLIKAALCLALPLLALGWSRASQAAECRKTRKVIESASSIQANTEMGGHVSIHVMGYPTEIDKTLFKSQNDFTTAFTTWRSQSAGHRGDPQAEECGGGNKTLMECVPAANLHITSASKCTAVSKGVCTATKNITPTHVAFRYAKNAKGSGGVWILNTAYPSKNEDCS